VAKKVFNIDANEGDANWTKQTWDLPFEPDSPEQASWSAAQGITEEEFRKGPLIGWEPTGARSSWRRKK
jgi:hypothetical protein